MNGTQWTSFHGLKIIWFFFSSLTHFASTSKEAADSTAQFNCSLSVAPPSCGQAKMDASWRRHKGYTA
jgi:hypothetical protein